MKVLIDTNVLYSAFITDSTRMIGLIEWVAANHEAFITSVIAEEIMEKTALRAPDSIHLVAAFLASGMVELVDDDLPDGHVHVKIRDKNDQQILDTAIGADVDVIITGDKDFHALSLTRPRIMYPADFAMEFMTNSK